jgi:hypothetical protein
MSKIKSKNAKIQLSISAMFTDIAQLIEFTAPDAEVQTYDATALDSSAGREKKITGFVNSGMMNFSLWFDPAAATLQALTDLITTPTDGSSWKIIWSDGATTTWTFSGVLKKVTPRAQLDSGLRADCQMEVDGIVTYPT